MTSGPIVDPTNPQTSYDPTIQPSNHSPKHTEDAAINYKTQSGTIQTGRPTAYQDMLADSERGSQVHTPENNMHKLDRSVGTHLLYPKDTSVGQGRAYMREERSPHMPGREKQPVYTRASDVARSQQLNSRRHDRASDDIDSVEIEGMHYMRLQEPSRRTQANIERPRDVRVAERRAYTTEEFGLYQSSKEDRPSHVGAPDVPRYSDNRQYSGVEYKSGHRSREGSVDTRHEHREQVSRDTRSILYDLQKTLENYEQEKKEMIKTTNVAIANAERAQQENRNLQAQLERQAEELRRTMNQLRQAETIRQQTLELLEVKTSELRGAQAFMSKEDSLSGADVLGMIKSLNAEILQVAAFMADSLEDLGKTRRGNVESARSQTIPSVGKYITRALKARQEAPEFDPMPVQIALQVALVHACQRVVNSWVLGSPQHNSIFDAIYTGIRDTEGQSVAGKWRAMTCSQIRNLLRKEAHAYIMENITDEIVETFQTAGYPMQDLGKHFFDKFWERLDAIGKLAYRIQEAVDEGLTSEDFCVSVISVGEHFDPEFMENTFLQNGDEILGERVAGTTDLGLSIQASKKTLPTILKKPKVVLASALQMDQSRSNKTR